MFLHHCFLLLATLPSFTLLASALRNRHFERRPHARAAQVCLLATSIIVLTQSLRLSLASNDSTTCIPAEPANTVTSRLNLALSSSGKGYILSLCPNEQYLIQAPILFTAPGQEISTAGYPTDNSRATLVVSGAGQTTAVDGTCGNCGGVKLRNVQARIFVYLLVDALFTSSSDQWKSCRSSYISGRSKYRDGRFEFGSID